MGGPSEDRIFEISAGDRMVIWRGGGSLFLGTPVRRARLAAPLDGDDNGRYRVPSVVGLIGVSPHDREQKRHRWPEQALGVRLDGGSDRFG